MHANCTPQANKSRRELRIACTRQCQCGMLWGGGGSRTGNAARTVCECVRVWAVCLCVWSWFPLRAIRAHDMVGITFVFMPLIRTRLGGGTVGVNAVCVCLVAVRLSVSWRPITEQRAYGTYRNATNKMLNTLKISTSNFVTLWCIKKNTAVPDLLKLCEFTTNGRTLKTL